MPPALSLFRRSFARFRLSGLYKHWYRLPALYDKMILNIKIKYQVVTDMFADQAYSLHTVGLMAATIICVLSVAVLLALGGEKLYKRPLFWMLIAMLLSLAAFAALRFVLLIAPTENIYNAVRKIQTAAGAVAAAAPLIVLLALIIRKYSAGLIFALAVISFLNILGTAIVLQTGALSSMDFYPAASFFVFCGFCLFFSKNLFPELSALSPEVFLNEPQDIILVFDRWGKLMKANKNAMEVFNPHEAMAREEFDAVLKRDSTVHGDKTIALFNQGEKRYFQYSETRVKKRGDALLATVLIFSDISEIMLLKSELGDRNQRLKAQGEKLAAYIKTVESLEAEEEKEKIVRRIEQAIGERLEGLAREMESDKASENLPRIIATCREIMAGVRLAVSGSAKTGEGDKRDD